MSDFESFDWCVPRMYVFILVYINYLISSLLHELLDFCLQDGEGELQERKLELGEAD